MTSSISLVAPAKMNLSLRLLSKRKDGYHEIETLMAPLALADEIELTHAHGAAPGSIAFTCNDPRLPTGNDNLCIKAAQAFQKALGINEAFSISLLKKIPHGAGLGGGSSDAAAVLRGMNELFDEPFVFEELHQLATSIGSDVPFFLDPKPRWCRGRGELLGEIVALPDWKLLLIKPPFPISAAEAYTRLKAQKGITPAIKTGVSTSPFINEVMNCGTDPFFIFNDLEAPVFAKYLQLPILKSWLQARPEVLASWMTGSGSTMVAVLKKEISVEKILELKKKIATEFGETFWIKKTNFV